MFGIGKKEDEISAEAPTENPTQAADAAAADTDSVPSTTPEPEQSSDTPLTDAPSQPEPAPESAPDSPPEIDQATTSDDAKDAFSSDDFHDFIETDVLTFLNVMNITHNGSRRDALVALKLNEDGIRRRMNLADAYLKLLLEYALTRDIPALVTEAETYLGKLAAMKQWLTM